MFENQPKGLYALALANTGERFGYYTMLAIFVLFLQANFGWGEGLAGTVYSTFLMLVYFLPIVGGAVADKIGFSKCVTFGILVMFIGYLLLAVPAVRGLLPSLSWRSLCCSSASAHRFSKVIFRSWWETSTTSLNMQASAIRDSQSSTWPLT